MAKKARILIVDDEKIWRDQLTEILEKDGYEIVTADSGARAIELIEYNKFSLLIVDIRMESEYKGIEVLEFVKKVFPVTPVIILTADGSPETGKNSIKKGAYNFFIKGEGASNEEIRNKVAEALRQRKIEG